MLYNDDTMQGKAKNKCGIRKTADRGIMKMCFEILVQIGVKKAVQLCTASACQKSGFIDKTKRLGF